ncbi:MAG: acyl-CoA mutase large subunit family protein [bacterium]|nr:acyl-CoA mutase large subunit family protein [Acidimicrobiia bacterium]MCY4649836.1 acyl-CoA mutase large subunit family protein [bacterium]
MSAGQGEGSERYFTASGIPLQGWYGPSDVPAQSQEAAAGPPGVPPYVRGAYPGMYRTKPWRVFQLSGHGNPEDERERILFLLNQGETGFIMEHDRNTADHLYNVDHPEVVARREDVGQTGAVIQSVSDYETILDGIDMGHYYAHPGGAVVQHAPFALGCYWTVARRRGLDLSRLAGTGQSDFFLTYLGCIPKRQIPTEAGVRLNTDIIEFCGQYLPRWVPVSIAAYNAADTGLNAYQELAALFANAVVYLDEIKRRAPENLAKLAYMVGGINLRVAMDFFEDICKMRAARKMWADLLRRRYGITDPRATRLRIHIVTAGSALAYQQPLNNIARGTIMAMASVLGGTQSLGVATYDEAMSVPSEHAHQMSLRIQQIIHHESNIPAVADPLGGSHYVEALTAELERRAWEMFEEIESRGGFAAVLDEGWLHSLAAVNQVNLAEAVNWGTKTMVGVNAYTEDVTPWEMGGFEPVEGVWEKSMERLRSVRRERDGRTAVAALRDLESVCRGDGNIMPAVMEAVSAQATLGEFGDVFSEVFGDWKVPISF